MTQTTEWPSLNRQWVRKWTAETAGIIFVLCSLREAESLKVTHTQKWTWFFNWAIPDLVELVHLFKKLTALVASSLSAYLGLFVCCFCLLWDFWDENLLCCPAWSGFDSIEGQVGLKLTELLLPLPPAHGPRPSWWLTFLTTETEDLTEATWERRDGFWEDVIHWGVEAGWSSWQQTWDAC